MYKQKENIAGTEESEKERVSGKKVYAGTGERRYRSCEDDNSIYEFDTDCMYKAGQQIVAGKE